MEEFYKRLNDKLGNPPKKATDWSVWNTIEKELDRKKRRFVLPFWFWPLGMLGVGVLGYFMGNQMRSSSPLYSHETTYLIDTIYLDRTITKTDTVYKEPFQEYYSQLKDFRNSNEALRSQLSSIKKNYDQSLAILDSYGRLIAQKGLLRDRDFQELPDIRKYEHYFKDDINPLVIDSPFANRGLMQSLELAAGIPLINRIAYDRTKPKIIVGLTVEQMKKMNPPPSILERLTPDYINLGMALEGPSLTLDQNGSSGNSIGVSGIVELMFSPRISLLTGINSISNSTKIEDELLSMGYPQPANVGENEVFENLNIKSTSLEIPLSLRYKFQSDAWAEPYIIGGVSWVKFRNVEYIFEYSNGNNETYYEVKNEISYPSSWAVHGGIGAVRSISNSFDLIGEVRFNYQLDKIALNRDRYYGLGLRLGALYKI